MSIYELLQFVLKSPATGAEYIVTQDEAAAINLIADRLQPEQGIAYLEEYRTGEYLLGKHGMHDKTNYEITFARLIAEGCTAEERIVLREEIRQKAVLPFVTALYAAYPNQISAVGYTMRYGRWDANEVSITIRFTHDKVTLC